MNDDAQTVYAHLLRAGLALRVERGVLRVSPRSKVTPELQALIAKNHDALVDYTLRRAANTPPARRLAELKAKDAAIALIDRIRAEVRSLPF